MFLQIDPSSGLAIYEQVVRQVKFAVARQAIVAGNLVPSVRELARELAINPNTVARAYQQLQADGVLQPVRGLGLQVSPGALKHCRGQRAELLQGRVGDALQEAFQSGLTENELRELVEKQLARVTRAGRPS